MIWLRLVSVARNLAALALLQLALLLLKSKSVNNSAGSLEDPSIGGVMVVKEPPAQLAVTLAEAADQADEPPLDGQEAPGRRKDVLIFTAMVILAIISIVVFILSPSGQKPLAFQSVWVSIVTAAYVWIRGHPRSKSKAGADQKLTLVTLVVSIGAVAAGALLPAIGGDPWIAYVRDSAVALATIAIIAVAEKNARGDVTDGLPVSPSSDSSSA